MGSYSRARSACLLARIMNPCPCLGAIEVEPRTGAWTFDGFPASVRIGRARFERSTGIAHLPNTLAHYREDVPRHSAHLYVIEREGSRSWVIEHVDEYNPHEGVSAAIRHYIFDVREPMERRRRIGEVRDWFVPPPSEPYVPSPPEPAPAQVRRGLAARRSRRVLHRRDDEAEARHAAQAAAPVDYSTIGFGIAAVALAFLLLRGRR
jgi:hypothetical protein